MTKIHKVVLLVVDHDDLGKGGVRDAIENVRYPNHCIRPRVMQHAIREIEWEDSHPINIVGTMSAEFRRLFGPEEEPQP